MCSQKRARTLGPSWQDNATFSTFSTRLLSRNFPANKKMPSSLWTFWLLSWASWTAGKFLAKNEMFTCMWNSTNEKLVKSNQRLRRQNTMCSQQRADLQKLHEAMKRQAQGRNPRVFVYDMPSSFNEDLLVKNPFCTYAARESWQSKYSAGYELGDRVRLGCTDGQSMRLLVCMYHHFHSLTNDDTLYCRSLHP